MNFFKIMTLFSLLIFSQHTLAYGSSSSTKTCKKPKFSEFTPVNLAKVMPGSEFSFAASSNTIANSIEVSIKDNPVDITVNKKNNGFVITGNLPADLPGTHARINIKAKGANKCKGSDGWLLEIAN